MLKLDREHTLQNFKTSERNMVEITIYFLDSSFNSKEN